jgi:hypothetical protein
MTDMFMPTQRARGDYTRNKRTGGVSILLSFLEQDVCVLVQALHALVWFRGAHGLR